MTDGGSGAAKFLGMSFGALEDPHVPRGIPIGSQLSKIRGNFLSTDKE